MSSTSRSRSPSGTDRQQSAQHYQTFPTPPPRSKGPRQSFGSEDTTRMSSRDGSIRHSRHASGSSYQAETPLPMSQLLVLAFIALCEQTALNSIAPYLPEMVARFPDVDVEHIGVYTGLIASTFALAQFMTNYFWGWLSDRIGRKPVVLMGTAFTAICFVGFGYSTRLSHAIIVQFLTGFVNGNQAVISTCLGELTDKSNQSKAFTYLPVIYGLGSITGPALGGLLSDRGSSTYPYLLPNLVAAGLLAIDFVLSATFLNETLEELKDKPSLSKRISNMFTALWQFAASPHPTYMDRAGKSKKPQETLPLLGNGSAIAESCENSSDDDDDEEDDSAETSEINPRTQYHQTRNRTTLESIRSFLPAKPSPETAKHMYNHNTILILSTFLVFQLANISFNSLYPIFAQAAEPLGRDLSPRVIGLSLAFAGIATIAFQIGVFGRIKQKLGNKATWCASLGMFVLVFFLMPFIPYKGPDNAGVRDGIFAAWQGQGILYVFLGTVLLLKTIAAIGGLTSSLLMITNSAPSPAVLGTLNGLAQTLSAGGRAIGPFVSGGLFSLAFRVPFKGEALPFGIFACITLLGFVLSLGIRGDELESDEQGSDLEDADGESISDDGDTANDDDVDVEQGARYRG